MDLNPYFKSIIEQDHCAVVICDMTHTIIYMNPAAIRRQAKNGGAALIGRSLLDCHSPRSREAILRIADWFRADPEHNLVYTFHNPKENKDGYMIALRDDDGSLIGYYERHEYRDPETRAMYDMP